MKKSSLTLSLSLLFLLGAYSQTTYIIGAKTMRLQKDCSISVVNENGVESTKEFKGIYPLELYAEYEVELSKQISKAISKGYSLSDVQQYVWGNPGTEIYYTRYLFTKKN